MILLRIVSATCLVLAPLMAFAGPGEDANAVVERWSAAYSSNDPDAIAKLYTSDAVLLGTVSPIMSEGTEAIGFGFEPLGG